MNVYLKTKNVTIAKDEKLNCLIISWHGLCNSTQYRQVIEMAVDIVQKEDIKHWISDNTEGRVVAISDHDWLFRKFIEKNTPELDSISTIDSRNIFRNIAVQKLVEQSYKVGIKINRFSTLKEAKQWIDDNFYKENYQELQQA
jgi:hypothetical protein